MFIGQVGIFEQSWDNVELPVNYLLSTILGICLIVANITGPGSMPGAWLPYRLNAANTLTDFPQTPNF